jgi:uncharacterized membrane protein
MSRHGHLWAIGYDDTEQAARTRERLDELAAKGCVTLIDTALAVRWNDGLVTLDGERFAGAVQPHGGLARFLASLALAVPPLTPAAVGAELMRAHAAGGSDTCIGDDFIQEVAALMKPGTSTLFVLDLAENLDAILEGIRGLGGSVLVSNVDLERATLIQSTLAAASFPA